MKLLTNLQTRFLTFFLLALSLLTLTTSLPLSTSSQSPKTLQKRADFLIDPLALRDALRSLSPTDLDPEKVFLYPRAKQALKITDNAVEHNDDFKDIRGILAIPAFQVALKKLGVEVQEDVEAYGSKFRESLMMGLVLYVKRAWIIWGLEGRYISDWHDLFLSTLHQRVKDGDLPDLYHLSNDVGDIRAKGAVRATENGQGTIKPTTRAAYQPSPNPFGPKPPKDAVKITETLYMVGNRYYSRPEVAYYIKNPNGKLQKSGPPTDTSVRQGIVNGKALKTGWFSIGKDLDVEDRHRMSFSLYYNADNDQFWIQNPAPTGGHDIWLPIQRPAFEKICRRASGGSSCAGATLEGMTPLDADPTQDERALKPGQKGYMDAYARAMSEYFDTVLKNAVGIETQPDTVPDPVTKRPTKKPAKGVSVGGAPEAPEGAPEVKGEPEVPGSEGTHLRPGKTPLLKTPPPMAHTGAE